MTRPKSNAYQKNPAFVATVLPDGKWIFCNNQTSHVTVVSASAGIFWELCNGEKDIDSLISELIKIYPEIELSQLKNDVQNILPKLLSEKLIF